MPTYAIKAPNGQTYRIDGPPGVSDADIQAEVLRQHPEASGQQPQAQPEAAPTDQVPPPPDPEAQRAEYRNHIQGMIEGDADIGAIEDYIRSKGVDPGHVTGLRQAIALHKLGYRPNVTLAGLVSGKSAPQTDITPETTAPDTSLLHNLGIAGKGFVDGVLDLNDLMPWGNGVANRLTGAPSASELFDAWLESKGAAQPQTSGQRIEESGARAVGGAAPLGGLGVVPATINAVSAAAGGAASQYAREQGAGPTTQLAAGLGAGLGTGGVLTAGRRSLGQALGHRVDSPIVQTFDRAGVDPLLPYVGGTGSRMASSVTHMSLGGIPLSAAAERTVEQAKAFRDRIASGMGAIKDGYGAGRAAQSGATAAVDRYASRASNLYNAIPINPEQPAVLNGTKAALADVNAGLPSNPDLSQIIADPRMQRIQAAINGSTEQVPTGVLDADGNPVTRAVQQGGKLSWQDIKAFRTYVGEKLNGLAFQNDTSQGALKRLYGGLSQDMEATARAQGPAALAAFQRANTYYRASQQRIQQVLTPILGKSNDGGAQSAFNQIQSWATNKGETANAARLIRSLPEEDAATVRATLFSRLGNANPGQQNAAGDAFSLPSFMTHWSSMDPRAKTALFPPESRTAIDDMVAVAERMRNSDKYANFSHTGMVGNAAGHATAVGGAIATLNPLLFLATGLTAAGEYGAGKMLASPGFARWATSLAKKPNPPAVLAHINRLSAVAASNPGVANEVLQLQERLARAFTQQPLAAAASPNQRIPEGLEVDGNGADQQSPQQGPTP